MSCTRKSLPSAVILLLVLMFPQAALAEDSPSDLWNRLPADILGKIPQALKPTYAETLGSDETRQTVLAMLAKVSDRSPRVDKAMTDFLWNHRATLKESNRQKLAQYVEENRKALEMLKAIPVNVSVPIRDQREAGEIDSLLSRFMYLGHLEAALLAEEGDYEGAAQLIIELLRFSAALYRAEAKAGFYAGAGRWHANTIGIARRIAKHEDIPNDVLLSLVRAAESTQTDVSLEPSLRRDFELLALPILAGLAVDESLSESIKRQVKIWGPKSIKIRGFDLDRELTERARQIQSLLEGHSNPLDREDTISLILTQFQQSINAAHGRVRLSDHPPPDYIQEVACWPDELTLNPMAVFRFALARGQEVVAQEDLKRIRARLATIDNPFGKHLASHQDPWGVLELHMTYLADSRCATLALAARTYHQQSGRLPSSLEKLVDSGILSRIPDDPFGTELRYSRKKQIIWSIGRDGRDDNGRLENLAISLDFLRMMAPIGVEVPAVEVPERPEADDRAAKILLPKAGNGAARTE